VRTRRRRSGRTHNRVLGRAAWHRRRDAINTFDPNEVVIGGGTASAGDLLLEPARRTALGYVVPGLGRNTRSAWRATAIRRECWGRHCWPSTSSSTFASHATPADERRARRRRTSASRRNGRRRRADHAGETRVLRMIVLVRHGQTEWSESWTAHRSHRSAADRGWSATGASGQS
jgi:hypothetical protein